jgi:hypothetical protein
MVEPAGFFRYKKIAVQVITFHDAGMRDGFYV